MSNKQNNKEYHEGRLVALNQTRHYFLNRSRLWIILRLLAFSAIPLTVFFGYPIGGYAALVLIIEVVVFLIFVRKSAENKERLLFTEHLISINENELKALDGDFSSFGTGATFTDHHHPYTYDMDVFGKDSFFSILNRTVTRRGEATLAHRIISGVPNYQEALEAIEELAEHPGWYQSYLAHGMQKKEEVDGLSVAEWAKKKIAKRSWMPVLSYIIPVLSISLTFLYAYDFIHGLYFSIGVLLIFLPVRQTLKQTNALHQSLSKLSDGIQAIQKQLNHLQEANFSSKLLQTYQQQFFGDAHNAQLAIDDLAKLVKQAEYRNNILVAILLNFYLVWDMRLTMKASKWIACYNKSIGEWEQIIFEYEALISGANYKRLFNDTTSKPNLEIDSSEDIIMESLGHPIIDSAKRVTNDLSLKDKAQFAIITGPNMAGKSTFLRSVGINVMMAQAGFHVMASRFDFPKVKLYSSMRTTDDLSEETSYFHAELLRLRFIMDAIEKGEPVFIILDEILKGTNSKDKEEGSRKFLLNLTKKGAQGLIATHDLSLTELAGKHDELVNLYFDTKIEGEEISFDYKIREGVAKNMNASFLLKKMKLTED